MKKRFGWLAVALGILGSSTMMVQADLGIESADSKSVSYSLSARSVVRGSEEAPENDLDVETNVETTLQLNTKEPCLIFYQQDEAERPELILGKDGVAKLSYYHKGLSKEHPVENGKIRGVIYLKPAQELGMDVSFELYSQDYSNYVKAEEKSGQSCLIMLHLTDKTGELERDALVYLKDGKADQDLLWYVDPKDIKAEILGVVPVSGMTEKDYTVDARDWEISDDVISEWAYYSSEAELKFPNEISGILVYGCEEINDVQYKQVLDAQQESYSICQDLPKEVLDQVYEEEDDILMEKALAAMPKGKPVVSIYGLAGLDEKNEIVIHSETKETYEDILKNAETVYIMAGDGPSYTSYESYLAAINGTETEAETETMTEAETDTMIEDDIVYNDADTIRKVQEILNGRGYNCGTVDGIIGKRTLAAIHAVQKDAGMEESDNITGRLLKEIGI